ncbi:MAG: hypothetical protein Q7T59_01345 [Candidatus Woesebacteria bacterium]|nr:hypothetical protein [Candidatus Woesebacteria bacterium]
MKFDVDRYKLAENLSLCNRVSKILKVRPGEVTNLTRTKSDPISREIFYTLMTISDQLKKS